MRKADLAIGNFFLLRSVDEDSGSLGSLSLWREGDATCLQGRRQLSLEARQEGTSNDNLHNMHSDLDKVDLGLPDLLDLELLQLVLFWEKME